MSWAVGENGDRFIGYGVPAYCDHPGCGAEIDRGLSHVCGDAPRGGEHGCGLYFCDNHRGYDSAESDMPSRCQRCATNQEPFEPTPEHPDWLRHVLTDDSWAEWRAENPDAAARYRAQQLNQ